MFKNLLRWQVFVFVVVAFFAYKKSSNDQHTQNKLEQFQLEIDRIAPKFTKLKNIYNADDTWLKKITDGNYGRKFTYQYEELWAAKDNILIYGKIFDIVSYDKENYIVKLDMEAYSLPLADFDFDLRFELTSSRILVEQFFVENPNFVTGWDSDIVAVIATIDQVFLESSTEDLDKVLSKGTLKAILKLGSYSVTKEILNSQMSEI